MEVVLKLSFTSKTQRFLLETGNVSQVETSELALKPLAIQITPPLVTREFFCCNATE